MRRLNHAQIGPLDTTAESIRIEQRQPPKIVPQFAPHLRQQVGIAGQPDGERLIVVEISRHQFRQANSMKHARRHSSHKCFANDGQQRDARPERRRSGRSGIIGNSVQIEIGKFLTGKML